MSEIAVIGEQLTLFEQERLAELEAVVASGLQTFVDVGLALQAIRDEQLYRATHGTFEDYCAARWGFTGRRGRQLMAAAEVGTIVPVGNEGQARELVPLLDDEAELIDTWRELRVEHGDRLTAEKVRDAVTQRLDIERRVGTLKSTGNNEWYTPAEYLQAVRDVLGGIDLDPASCQLANETVGATTYYDEATDGLAAPWSGRVFLNPPYGTVCGEFVAKALEEYRAGRVQSAVLLLNGYSYDVRWFRPLWDYLLCFTYGRIDFYSPVGVLKGGTTGSVFVYLGSNRDRFIRTFDRFGAVVERVAA